MSNTEPPSQHLLQNGQQPGVPHQVQVDCLHQTNQRLVVDEEHEVWTAQSPEPRLLQGLEETQEFSLHSRISGLYYQEITGVFFICSPDFPFLTKDMTNKFIT